MKRLLLMIIVVFALAPGAYAQADLTPEQEKKVQKAFETANGFMEAGKRG